VYKQNRIQIQMHGC